MTSSERRYYVLSAGYNLAQFFIAPVYPLFLLSRGLDLFQINAVLAVYGITVFLFEVPTGAVADVVGRRVSCVLGCVVRMAAYGVYTQAHSFQQCLAAEFLDAIGTAFVSGALDAWVVDGMRREGDRGPTDRVFARAAVIARTLMIAGGLAAGYLAEDGFTLVWLIAAAFFGLTALGAAVAMDEGPRAPRTESVRTTAGAGLALVGRSRVLLLLCLLSLASAFAAFPMHMLWQPHLKELGAERISVMGWVVALLNVTSLVGSALLPRLLRRFRREAVLAGAAVWRGATVGLLAGATALAPALGGLLLQEVAFGLTDPVMLAWLNEHVSAAQRATVLSVRSTFMTFGAAAGLVTIGLIARAFGTSAAFAAAAAVFVLIAPGYALLGRVGAPAARSEDAAVEALGPAPGKVV